MRMAWVGREGAWLVCVVLALAACGGGDGGSASERGAGGAGTVRNDGDAGTDGDRRNRDGATGGGPDGVGGAGGQDGAAGFGGHGDGGHAGSDAGAGAAGAAAVDIYDWRSGECESFSGGLTEPQLAAAAGKLELIVSSNMQPLGYVERIAVDVRAADSDEIDTALAGDFVFESDAGVEVVDRQLLSEGRGAVSVRFLSAGKHALRVRLTDGSGREGTLEMFAYRSQLEVWEMTIAPGDLAAMLEDPYTSIERPATLAIDGVSYPSTVRLHGGTSRGFPKVSFRFDLDDKLPDGSNHVILRAEYADKSLLRNYLGAEVFRSASSIPVSRTRMVHFRLNQGYYGVMWHVERIDKDFLRARDMFPGSMYEADPPNQLANPGGNLSPLASLDQYQQVYDQKDGPAGHTDLIALIEQCIALPHDQFMRKVNTELDVDEYLRYMAIMAVLQNQDHIRKNYYLYRDLDSAAYARWTVLPWDVDLSWGHLWSEENDVLEEAIITNGNPYAGQQVEGSSFYNELMTQLWLSSTYDERFWGFVQDTLDRAFKPDFLDARIDEVVCRATPDILADRQKRASNAEYASRIQELRDFLAARRTFLGQQNPYLQ